MVREGARKVKKIWSETRETAKINGKWTNKGGGKHDRRGEVDPLMRPNQQQQQPQQKYTIKTNPFEAMNLADMMKDESELPLADVFVSYMKKFVNERKKKFEEDFTYDGKTVGQIRGGGGGSSGICPSGEMSLCLRG